MQTYLGILDWLKDKPKTGFWILVIVLGFLLLSLVFLIIDNLRLKLHIVRIDRDKKRLMEEKDMMRKAVSSQGPSAG